MRPKVEACIRAATGGVERTHIIDGRAPDSLLLEVFTGVGLRHHDRRPQGKGDLSWRGPGRLRSTSSATWSRSPRCQRHRGGPIGQFVEQRARASWGLDVARDDDGVRHRRRRRARARPRASSRTSTPCPPGEGWTRPPFEPVIEGDRLYGRGSGDAKASVAAMLTAARDLSRRTGWRGPAAGALLGYGEETKHTTMPGRRRRGLAGSTLRSSASPPTSQVAVAQRGLMMADLVARGDQRHAGYAGESAFRNASRRWRGNS